MSNVLGERVQKRRNELGMTQEQLAFDMGYKSRSSINKIENGRPVSQKIITRLSSLLHCTPEYLLGWTDEPYSLDNSFDFKKSKNGLSESAGNRIAEAMNIRGINKEELVNIINKSVDFKMEDLEKIIDGYDSRFSVSLLKILCESFDVPPSFFIETLVPVENIGRNMGYIRSLTDVSKDEMAEYLGITVDELIDIECGKDPMFSQIQKFADYYSILPSTLIGDDFTKMTDSKHIHRLKLLKHLNEWEEEVGEFDFSDSEIKEIMDAAKYVIYKRGHK